MRDFKGEERKFILLSFCFIFGIVILSDLFLSFSLIGYRYLRKKNYLGTINKIHYTRIIFSPLMKKNYLGDIPKEINYLGSLEDNSVEKKYFIPSGIYGWRLGKSLAVSKSPYGIYDPAIRLTNSQGFSSSGDFSFFYKKNKPKNTFRIIFLGGSTVEGDGAESIKNNLPAKFKKNVNSFLKSNIKNIEVINAGVGGYKSSQELLYFITELTEYKPDLVIFYNGWNDFQFRKESFTNNGNEYITKTHKKNQMILSESYKLIGSYKRAIFISANSLIDFFKGTGFGQVLITSSKFLPQNTNSIILNTKNNLSISEINFAANKHISNMRNAASIAENLNIKFAFFLQPIMGIDNRKPFGEIEEELSKGDFSKRVAYYKIARKMINEFKNQREKKGSICIRDISNDPFNGYKNRVYEDNGHLLGLGNDLVSKRIISELISCEILDAL